MYFRVMLSVSCMLMYAGIVHAAPFAYIANKADNTVSVVDTASNTVTATVPVGQSPYGVAVNAIGGRAFISNQNSRTISVIDTMDNSVSTIPASGVLTNQPGGLAVNSAGTRLFVADNDGTTVSVFDTATGNKLGSVDLALTGNAQPDGVAIGPVTAGVYKVYVTCFGTNQVKIVTANDATALNTWPVAAVNVGTTLTPQPKGVAVSADGSMVFVANMDENTVSVINGSTNAIIGSPIAVGSTPFGLAVTPDGTKVYVANSSTVNLPYTVTVLNVNTTTKTVTGTSTVNLTNGQMPMGIAVTADGVKVVTANNYTTSASTINVSDNSLVALAPAVGQSPVSLGKFAGPFLYDVTTSVSAPGTWFGPGGKISPPAGIVSISPQGVIKVGAGQNITFSVVPDSNFTIANVLVNGASVGAAASVSFTNLTAPQTISATFNKVKWDLKVSTSGLGTGVVTTDVGGINCGTACTAALSSGTTVTLSAAGTNGAQLISWGGSCSGYGSSPVCYLTLNESFAQGATDQYGVYISANNSGVFDVTASFSIPPQTGGPVRTGRGGTVAYHQTLQAAYDAVAAGTALNPIDIVIGSYPLAANKNVAVTLVGGWTDTTYGGITGAASISGGFTISLGSVTIGSSSNAGAIIIK